MKSLSSKILAVLQAKELLKRLQEEDAAASSSGEEGGDGTSMLYDDRPRENWDCESILTSRSTAYNHPKRLDDLSRRRSGLVHIAIQRIVDLNL